MDAIIQAREAVDSLMLLHNDAAYTMERLKIITAGLDAVAAALREPEPSLLGTMWQDADPRVPNRYLRVERLADGYAFCKAYIRLGGGYVLSEVTRPARIKVSRLRAGSRGYRQVEL